LVCIYQNKDVRIG